MRATTNERTKEIMMRIGSKRKLLTVGYSILTGKTISTKRRYITNVDFPINIKRFLIHNYLFWLQMCFIQTG